jgi:hypothetical protein
MAEAIRATPVDPDDDEAVREALLAAGFTDRTIEPLAFLAAFYAAMA